MCSDCERMLTERDTAVAESAAMRGVLVRAREQLSCGEDIDGHSCPPSTCVVAAIEVAIAGSAGRALAERVRLLETMLRQSKQVFDQPHAHDKGVACSECAMSASIGDALDEKGTIE